MSILPGEIIDGSVALVQLYEARNSQSEMIDLLETLSLALMHCSGVNSFNNAPNGGAGEVGMGSREGAGLNEPRQEPRPPL